MSDWNFARLTGPVHTTSTSIISCRSKLEWFDILLPVVSESSCKTRNTILLFLLLLSFTHKRMRMKPVV